MGTTVTLQASDGFELGAYRAEPEGTPRGGVVVIQEIFGVNVHIRAVADGYAAEGYLAIAPALFDRVERGVELGYEDKDIEQGIGLARGKVDYATVTLDLAAAARAAAEGGRVGVVGYCWGGMLACTAAIQLADDVAAAVGYYGGGTVGLVDQTPAVPLLLHFGEVDHAIPLEDVERIRTAWPQAEVYVYPGAQHGFNCDLRASYDATSAATARERTLAFFAANL
jgi:carboxymethylenebutenolidase